ncbi:uncharacterized protein [Eurosta solidaginis]|uniref:uncharacterized protein n=1 Tax=Eurosta solidaginis TaxID=178769 RepID=UPI0035314F91
MWILTHVNCFRVFALALLIGHVENKYFKLKGISCISRNESTYKFKTCELKPIKRYVSELSVHLKLSQVIVTKVKVSLFLKRRNDQQNRSILEYHIDGCAFFRNKRRNLLAELFYNFLGIKTHSNMNHTCPYDHDVYIDHYTINNKATFPIPVGSYGIYTQWELNGVRQIDANLFIEAFD